MRKGFSAAKKRDITVVRGVVGATKSKCVRSNHYGTLTFDNVPIHKSNVRRQSFPNALLHQSLIDGRGIHPAREVTAHQADAFLVASLVRSKAVPQAAGPNHKRTSRLLRQFDICIPFPALELVECGGIERGPNISSEIGQHPGECNQKVLPGIGNPEPTIESRARSSRHQFQRSRAHASARQLRPFEIPHPESALPNSKADWTSD